ncbi:MAG: hypothetical protein ACREPS_07335 [Rhodanobacteraceae bacterium]
MNKILLGTTLAALCGAATFALPVLAQQTTTSNTQASTQTTGSSQAKAKTNAQRAVPPLDSRQCIRDTGSLIPPPKGQCLPVAGNSYSQQDIEGTGATNIGQALQMLDPSVTSGGH